MGAGNSCTVPPQGPFKDKGTLVACVGIRAAILSPQPLDSEQAEVYMLVEGPICEETLLGCCFGGMSVLGSQLDGFVSPVVAGQQPVSSSLP